ncbi:MAG: PDZ domain-containing protein [Phycisphaerales bacterium]
MMRPSYLYRALPVFAAAAFAGASQPAAQPDEQAAQPDTRNRGQVDTGVEVRELVELLGSDSWLERDLAMIELGGLHPRITLEDLEGFLPDPDLSAEQLARLVQAARDRYMTHPKGALGVSFGTIRIGSIEVMPIQDDERFPASAMLRGGDQIAMVGDTVIDGSLSLRAQILSREPGDTLPVLVIRLGELIEMDLPLGSYDELTGAARMDPELMRMALMLRWQRLGIEVPRPESIGTDIGVDSWARAAFPEGAQPDPRDPDRRTRTALVISPEMPVSTGYGYRPTVMTPWASEQDLHTRTGAERTEINEGLARPLIAKLDLLGRYRDQIATAMAGAEGADADELASKAAEIEEQITRTHAELGALAGPDSEQP